MHISIAICIAIRERKSRLIEICFAAIWYLKLQTIRIRYFRQFVCAYQIDEQEQQVSIFNIIHGEIVVIFVDSSEKSANNKSSIHTSRSVLCHPGVQQKNDKWMNQTYTDNRQQSAIFFEALRKR